MHEPTRIAVTGAIAGFQGTSGRGGSAGAPRRAALVAGIGLVAVFACSPPSLGSGDGASDPEAGPVEDGPLARQQQVVLVTGSTGGLGREVARRLAAEGTHVIVHGRNRERGAALVEEIEAEGVGSARFYPADLGSFDEVRALAASIRRDHDRLDVLVNNAGIWLEGPRRTSEDGHELHFQVNYLSHYLLTRELLPLLVESAPSRIVNVSSSAQRPIDFDDVMLEEGYGDGRAYAQSKLAQVMLTFDLAEELEGTGVTVAALHPATLMDTGMVLERGIEPRASVEEGAEAVMSLITSPDVESGSYWRGTRPAEAHRQAYDEEARRRLRELSEALTGAG